MTYLWKSSCSSTALPMLSNSLRFFIHSILVVDSVGRLVVGRFVSKFFTFQVFCDDLYIKWPKKGKQIAHFSPFYVRNWFQLGTCLIEINVEKVATHPGCEKTTTKTRN